MAEEIEPQGQIEPTPLVKGRFAVYELETGDALLAYQADGEDEPSNQVIPGAIWRLVQSAIAGEPVDVNPLELMSALMGA